MTDPSPLDPARSFGSVAGAYDRARPTYPREAAAWLVGEEPVTVLELGAGTGKLTEVLVALGHDVHATDPDDAMLARLRERLPDVLTSVASAEQIPAPDGVFDVVVVAQAFHWFDHERALPEIARVLKPGGRLALVWNRRDERIPWVRRLGAIIGSQDQLRSEEPLILSEHFGLVEDETFRHWQVVDRDSIQELALSRSSVAVLDDEGRAATLAEVLAFYDDYGRGMDGMQLPYVAACFRAVVADRQETESEAEADTDTAPEMSAPVADDGADPDVLLIDFR
ncbi:class I SAM-dependent methyltransferase [Nocardioides hungaricus]